MIRIEEQLMADGRIALTAYGHNGSPLAEAIAERRGDVPTMRKKLREQAKETEQDWMFNAEGGDPDF